MARGWLPRSQMRLTILHHRSHGGSGRPAPRQQPPADRYGRTAPPSARRLNVRQHERPRLAAVGQQAVQVVHGVLRVARCCARLAPAETGPIIAAHARKRRNVGLDRTPIERLAAQTGIHHHRGGAGAGAVDVHTVPVDHHLRMWLPDPTRRTRPASRPRYRPQRWKRRPTSPHVLAESCESSRSSSAQIG
jgi:hypothetical protein